MFPDRIENDDFSRCNPESPKKTLVANFVSKLDIGVFDEWISIGGYIWRLYDGSIEGLDLWDALSQEDSNYDSYKDCAKHWDSFTRRNSTPSNDGIDKATLRAIRQLFKSADRKFTESAYFKGIKSFSDKQLSSVLIDKSVRSDKQGATYVKQYDPETEELISLEVIDTNGKKRQIKGGRKGILLINKNAKNKTRIYHVESLSTGITVALATNCRVFVCFGTSNFNKSVSRINKRHPHIQNIIAADSGPAGERAAEEASSLHRCSYVVAELSKAETPSNTDFNDVHETDGLQEVKRQLLQPKINRGLHFSKFDINEPLIPLIWMVDGFLYENSNNTFIAPSGAGKTFVLCGLACSMATGTSFHGHAIRRKLSVVIVAGEGNRGLRIRIRAWFIHHGINPGDARIFISNQAADLYGNPQLLIDTVKVNCGQVDVFFYDTLNRNAPGIDENAAKEMSVVIQNVDRINSIFDSSSVMVHHTPKNNSRQGRGSNSLFGAVDTELLLESKGGTNKGIGLVELSCNKMKEGEHFQPINLRSIPVELGLNEENGNPITSIILERIESFAGTPALKLGKNQQILLNAIQETPVDGEGHHDLTLAFQQSKIDTKRKREVIDSLITKSVIEVEGGLCRIL